MAVIDDGNPDPVAPGEDRRDFRLERPKGETGVNDGVYVPILADEDAPRCVGSVHAPVHADPREAWHGQQVKQEPLEPRAVVENDFVAASRDRCLARDLWAFSHRILEREALEDAVKGESPDGPRWRKVEPG